MAHVGDLQDELDARRRGGTSAPARARALKTGDSGDKPPATRGRSSVTGRRYTAEDDPTGETMKVAGKNLFLPPDPHNLDNTTTALKLHNLQLRQLTNAVPRGEMKNHIQDLSTSQLRALRENLSHYHNVHATGDHRIHVATHVADVADALRSKRTPKAKE